MHVLYFWGLFQCHVLSVVIDIEFNLVWKEIETGNHLTCISTKLYPGKLAVGYVLSLNTFLPLFSATL